VRPSSPRRRVQLGASEIQRVTGTEDRFAASRNGHRRTVITARAGKRTPKYRGYVPGNISPVILTAHAVSKPKAPIWRRNAAAKRPRKLEWLDRPQERHQRSASDYGWLFDISSAAFFQDHFRGEQSCVDNGKEF
jgi:hypothetical protein